jgi:restriction system protein
MNRFERSFRITPEQYEQQVRGWVETAAGQLSEFSSTHREVLQGSDGEYEIDIVVRFRALQTPFLVLLECKRYRRAIERVTVQVLNDKVRSIGANKGILFSTSKFQLGALEYAEKHGIALIQLIDGDALIMGRGRETLPGEPLFPSRPDFFGMRYSLALDGKRKYSSILPEDFAELRRALGISSLAYHHHSPGPPPATHL